MYRYYGAPAVAFGKGGLSEQYDFRAGGASSQAQAAPAAPAAITASDLSSALTASDPQRHAQVAAAEAPNGMAPAAAATVMHHAELNAHFSHPLPRNAPGKKIPKVVQPVTYEVCKMHLTSVNDIRNHETGKKHKKNLEKLQDSITPKLVELPNGADGANTTPSAALADGMMPAVQPKKRKRAGTTPKDLEAGAAEGELKNCTMSNVVKKIPKVVQPVTCEVCKMHLTSVNDIRNHETGKKHKKNLEKLQDSITPEPAKPPNDAVGASTEAAAAVTDGVMPAVQPKENKSSAATPEDVEAGAAEGAVKRIWKFVQPVTCEVCKTYHASLHVLRDHETSGKHKKNLEKLQDSITPEPAKPPNDAAGASTEPAAAAVTDGVMPAVQPMENKSSAATPEDLEAGAAEGEVKICTISKIPKVVKPVTCEVCKTFHISLQGFRDHEKTSRKHQKNLEKLQDSITPEAAKPPNDAVGASTEPAAASVTDGVMPAVNPMKRKRYARTPEDLEVKKRRAIELGAAEGELKICTMCNVVCINQKVYEDHAAGQKHKAKLQKQQQAQLPDVA